MPGTFHEFHRRLFPGDWEGKSVDGGLLDILRPLNGKVTSLLDVGCGRGDLTKSCAEALGLPLSNVFGIEAFEQYRVVAEKLFVAKRGDIESAPFDFPDASLDVVICNQILEHVKNLYFVLDEAERVLKPGGYLIVGVPNLTAYHNRLLVLLGAQPMCLDISGPHVRGYAYRAFQRFLKANPAFELIDKKGALIFPFPFLDPLARVWPGVAAYVFYALRKARPALRPGYWLSHMRHCQTTYTGVPER